MKINENGVPAPGRFQGFSISPKSPEFCVLKLISYLEISRHPKKVESSDFSFTISPDADKCCISSQRRVFNLWTLVNCTTIGISQFSCSDFCSLLSYCYEYVIEKLMTVKLTGIDWDGYQTPS